MLTASAFFLDAFPPLRGLKRFICILLLLLYLSNSAQKIKQKQKDANKK